MLKTPTKNFVKKSIIWQGLNREEEKKTNLKHNDWKKICTLLQRYREKSNPVENLFKINFFIIF